MNKNKNPYIALVNTMREQGAHLNPPSIELGTVTSVSPLSVSVGDLQLNKDNLLVADYLLPNYSRDLQVNGTTNTYIAQNGLNNGDLVALVQISSNAFLIICKVVSM